MIECRSGADTVRYCGCGCDGHAILIFDVAYQPLHRLDNLPLAMVPRLSLLPRSATRQGDARRAGSLILVPPFPLLRSRSDRICPSLEPCLLFKASNWSIPDPISTCTYYLWINLFKTFRLLVAKT